MQSRRSPTRTRPSQVPALPPLVAPWQQEETIPNNPRPQPPTHPPAPPSPSNKVSSTSGHHYTSSNWEEEGDRTRLEKLESRVAILEQMNCALLEQLAASKTDRDVEGGSIKEELAGMLSEANSRVEKLEHRVSLNERSLRTEEARVTTLVKSTQEIEQGILDGQKQLLQRREDHDTRLEGIRESVHQLEQKQLQLGEFVRRVHASFAMESSRLDEGVKKVKNHMENMRGSIGGKLKELEHGHRALEERLLVADGAVTRLDAQVKKQTDSWASGMRNSHSDLHRKLVELGKEKQKQDLQLRESFVQVQGQIQRHASHLWEWLAGELRKSSENMVAENAQLKEDVISVVQYSQRECGKARESLQMKLETRITAIEESLESEKKASVSHLEELHSVARKECEEARAELVREITAKLQQGEQGREVLQGALSVAEKESKASRQELLTVVEAEIKTRNLEVCRLQSQYQALSKECCSSTDTVRSRLEAMEERATIDREQLQSVRESLVSEWQAIAAQLLSDFDSRLSAVHTHIANLERNTHPPSQALNGGEQDTKDSRDVEGGSPGLLHHDVLQWKREVVRQLGSVRKQLGEESQRIAGLNQALRELQIKLVGAIQQETNQRFRAVLELKNELTHLAAGMPLFPQHIRGPPPDHDDSLDTSHIHSSQHMSMELPHPSDQQLAIGTHQQGCDTTSVSGASFITEQGDGEGGREGEAEDYAYDTHIPQNPLEQSSPAYSMQDSHNPLHSKSHVALMSHHSTGKPTNVTLELPGIAENEAELLTPAQQAAPSEPGHVTSANSDTGREESKRLDREDDEGDPASAGDKHSSQTMSVQEGQYDSPENDVSTLESGEPQELNREDAESKQGPGEGDVVWSIGEHN